MDSSILAVVRRLPAPLHQANKAADLSTKHCNSKPQALRHNFMNIDAAAGTPILSG